MHMIIWTTMQDVIALAAAVDAFVQSGKASGHVRIAIDIVVRPGCHFWRLVVPNAAMMQTAQPQPQLEGGQ